MILDEEMIRIFHSNGGALEWDQGAAGGWGEAVGTSAPEAVLEKNRTEARRMGPPLTIYKALYLCGLDEARRGSRAF